MRQCQGTCTGTHYLTLPGCFKKVLKGFCCNTNRCYFRCRALEFIEGVTSSANKAGVFASPTATAYWAYHLTRTGFLAIQGLSGALLLFRQHISCSIYTDTWVATHRSLMSHISSSKTQALHSRIVVNKLVPIHTDDCSAVCLLFAL